MTADTVGGVWTYALELVAGLVGHDVDVHVATMGRRPAPAQREEAARAGVAGLHESDFALEWMRGAEADLAPSGDWLLGLEAALRPDVVHLNGYAHAALAWGVPVVVAGHSCVVSWWWAVHGSAPPASCEGYRQRVTAGLAGADAVVVPTPDMGSSLARWYGCANAIVIGNCRRDDWVRPARKEPLVMGVGRVWDEAKNLALLDRVAARLDWPVAIAGDRGAAGGTDPGAAGATFLGQLPFSDLSGWLLRASVFAAPARYEPFGLAALEAAHAGCALVLGNIASVREVWGAAAAYVGCDDEEGLLAALRRLVADPDELRRLAAAARARARDHLPGAMAAAYARLYSSLRERRGVPA